jgi:hypothetical protein
MWHSRGKILSRTEETPGACNATWLGVAWRCYSLSFVLCIFRVEVVNGQSILRSVSVREHVGMICREDCDRLIP